MPFSLSSFEHEEGSLQCSNCGSSFHMQLHSTVSFAGDEIGADETADIAPRVGDFTTPEKPRQTIGRFEVLQRLGAGGFGVVYRVHDPDLERVVALKLPHRNRLAETTSRERFVREARHLAQLRHPNIVPLYEIGTEGETPFLVTEFLPGSTLADVISARRLSPDEAAGLCAKLAEALHHAHESGIVHRDVKPGNVMVSEDGEPHLMDFGLAKQQVTDITVSAEGLVLGTPAYMSPEQAVGDSHEVDHRSDIYSLGVVLYEVITGERPFRGNPHMLLHHVLHDDPARPRSLDDAIPRDLEMVCLRAMNKQPQHRYATAAAFDEDLQRFLRREPVAARPAGVSARIWLWCRRAERIRGASTIAIAMLVMLALWEGISLIFLALGHLDVPNPLKSAAEISFGIFSFSTLAGVAWMARSRIVAALWFGLVSSVVLLLFSAACLAGWIEIDGLSSKAVRIPIFSFFSIAAVFVLVAHCVSITAYYANRDVIRWAKRVSN